MEIRRATGEADLQACLAIRNVVFIKEQDVPPHEEVDGKDPVCLHYLVIEQENPVATARVMPLANTAKIQRVAVLKEGRSAGIGSKLMVFILSDLQTNYGFGTAILGSQTHAIGFYEKLGFQAFGPEYDDAGIPHRDMRIAL